LFVGIFMPAIRAIYSTYASKNYIFEWIFPFKILKLKNRAILLCKSTSVNVINLAFAYDEALYI